MSAVETELPDLYLDLAEVHARLGEHVRAADEFALALYYAHRAGNQPLVERCRTRIAQNNPNHILCRQPLAPLCFGPLLIAYPPDRSRDELARLRSVVLIDPACQPETGTSAHLVSAELGSRSIGEPVRVSGQPPSALSPAGPPQESLGSMGQGSKTVSAAQPAKHPDPDPDWVWPGTAAAQTTAPSEVPWPGERAEPASASASTSQKVAWESHHGLHASLARKPGPRPPFELVDDFAFEEDAGIPEPVEEEGSLFARPIHVVACLTLAVGLGAAGFFAYRLAPALLAAWSRSSPTQNRWEDPPITGRVEETPGSADGGGPDSDPVVRPVQLGYDQTPPAGRGRTY